MDLSEEQRKKLGDYLSSQAKSCSKCGTNDWDFGNIELPAAEIALGNKEMKPFREFVEITCRSCGETSTIDCLDAGISEI